jgi:hypothetical protein
MNCPECGGKMFTCCKAETTPIIEAFEGKEYHGINGVDMFVCRECWHEVTYGEVAEALELSRLLEAMPDNCCLEHSEGWEHGNEWFIIAYHSHVCGRKGLGMGTTPLEALRNAHIGDQPAATGEGEGE